MSPYGTAGLVLAEILSPIGRPLLGSFHTVNLVYRMLLGKLLVYIGKVSIDITVITNSRNGF